MVENITMKKQYLFSCLLLLSISYAQYTRTSMMPEQYNDPVSQAAQVEQCGICLGNLAPDNAEDPLQRLACNHGYCYSCIAHWAAAFHYPNRPTCPQCRTVFNLGLDPVEQPGQPQERVTRAGRLLNQAKEHRYILVGTALVATGALAYKFRKPLAKLVAQAKAKAHNAYRKLLTLRIFKAHKNTAEARASTR